MTFINFSQLSKIVFHSKSKENAFIETKPNFSLTGKYFLLTNFLNDKQTNESLESDFQKITFRKINAA